MNRLSGDQNGNCAPSVPGSGSAVSESIARTHKRTLPAVSRAVNVIFFPSGEMLALVPVRPPVTNSAVAGGAIDRRVTVGAEGRET
jgi:hypothetical protein